MEYEEILLPTDGSDTANMAAERAIDAARRYDATLNVLSVAERTRDDPEAKGLKEKLAEEVDDARDVVESITERAEANGVATERAVEVGVPRTTIEDYADERGVDLIVVGSTGADDVSDKLLGTVAKYVVNEAPADVLVVRPDAALS